MRRLGYAVLAIACAAAGALTSVVLAGGVGAAGFLTTGTTTGTTTTGTTTTNPLPVLIPPGVTISGISVGGLTIEEATNLVQEQFEQTLPLVLDRRHRLAPPPAALGASAHVDEAINRARSAPPGSAITLPVLINGDVVRAYVLRVAKRFNRKPVDAQVFLRNLKPVIVPERPGLAVNRLALTQTIVSRLRATSRTRVRIRHSSPLATTRRSAFRSVIVIRRGSNHLYLYRYDRLRRLFRVATGQSVYPTPLGRFTILVKWRNPWWYPPNSRWAKGQSPIPPGPNNPLGTRWMGLSAPGVGIHGTPNPASIGYSVSHGCIRMYISDAEWLFDTVDIGTTVFIVSA
ncbi:MAG TPA: L,D-transpeptidase/peptidoglycan binding protein [Gaiellaceae bacterium]